MKFPSIIDRQQETDQSAKFILRISPDLEAFAGHFDSFPIIPGVVQVQWALHFFNQEIPIAKTSGLNWQVEKLSTIKFQQVITPNTDIELYLQFDPDKQCLQFKISSGDNKHSSGKLFLQAVGS